MSEDIQLTWNVTLDDVCRGLVSLVRSAADGKPVRPADATTLSGACKIYSTGTLVGVVLAVREFDTLGETMDWVQAITGGIKKVHESSGAVTRNSMLFRDADMINEEEKNGIPSDK